MACVGIVGGLGVGATIHYYERITAACRALGVAPDLVIVHADVEHAQGLIRAGQIDELADYVAAFIERMGHAGAMAAAIPAVTPHLAIDRIKRRTQVPIIDIMDTIRAELRTRAIDRVALFGSIFTMQGSLWGQLGDVEIVKARPDEMEFVGRAYQRILDTRRADASDAERLRLIAGELQRRDGVQAILLAGTDLTVMFDETTAGFPAIDVARPHLEAIVARLAS
jgi:aspartate racemase